jgi:hypothetical protein
MSRMKEVAQCIDDLNTASRALASAAYGLGYIFGGMAAEPQQETPKPVTLEEVRGILSAKAADGKREAVKALLGKYGAEQLSAIPPERYGELLKDAEGL